MNDSVNVEYRTNNSKAEISFVTESFTTSALPRHDADEQAFDADQIAAWERDGGKILVEAE